MTKTRSHDRDMKAVTERATVTKSTAKTKRAAKTETCSLLLLSIGDVVRLGVC